MQAQIRGRLLTASGRPAVGATVRVEMQDRRSRRRATIGESRSERNGRFAIEGEIPDLRQAPDLLLRVGFDGSTQSISGDPQVNFDPRRGRLEVDYGEVKLEQPEEPEDGDGDRDGSEGPRPGSGFDYVGTISSEKIGQIIDDTYIKDVVRLQHDLRLREDQIASLRDQLGELELDRDKHREELAGARDEVEKLRDQVGGEVEVESLYVNIGRQLRQARQHLADDGIPYRLGKVSLSVKTLVGDGGNKLFMPNLADFPRIAAGALADMTFEFQPTGDDEAGTTVVVPDFSGLTETAARRLANAQGLRLEMAQEARGDRDVGVGQAFKQTPSINERVPAGGTVLVVFAQA